MYKLAITLVGEGGTKLVACTAEAASLPEGVIEYLTDGCQKFDTFSAEVGHVIKDINTLVDNLVITDPNTRESV